MLNWLKTQWCAAMHPAPMWPSKGQYICPTCFRTWPVDWQCGADPTLRAERPERKLTRIEKHFAELEELERIGLL